MRTPLATLTMAALLSLGGVASADVYKCQAPGGKTIYQDAPCSVEAAPLVESTRPPAQITSTEAHCQGFAAVAEVIAVARNRGASLADILAVARTSFFETSYPPALQQQLRETLQALAMQVYEQSWIRPRQAKIMAEVACLKALQSPPVPTLHTPQTQY